MKNLRRRHIEIAACLLAFVCLVLSTERCIAMLTATQANATSEDPARVIQAGWDVRMWINAVIKYQATGELYEKPVAAHETVESLYAPMTPRARFTPFFHVQFLPFANSQHLEQIIARIQKGLIAIYFIACLGLIIRCSNILQQQEQPRIRIFLFYLLAAIAATSNFGLQDAVQITNYEIVIFSLLILSFLIIENHPKLSAIIIGFLGSAKFYPGFMAIFLLIKRDKGVIFPLVISVLAFFLIGLVGFGLQENLFYWKHAFPVMLSEEIAAIAYNMSFGGAIYRHSESVELSNFAFKVYRVIFFGLTFLLLAKRYAELENCKFEVFALLMTLMLICLPNYWQTYLIILFPAFCAVACRIVVSPSIATVAIFLICVASIATDNNSWVRLDAPAWITGNAVPDEAGRQILAAGMNKEWGKAFLLLSWHYPRTASLYVLEQIKFLVPAILWYLTASALNAHARTLSKSTVA